MKTIAASSILAILCFFSAASILAAPKPNPHNTYDCLFCHKETPRFGIDTRQTVTFNEATWDDPALCLRCHRPEENLHPIEVKPGDGTMATVTTEALPLGTALGLEEKIVCETCHFVHAAESGHALLRGFPGSQRPDLFESWQDLCRDCHRSNLEKESPHMDDKQSCAFCHMATPKEGEKVTVAPRGVALCNFCHGAIQDAHYEKANPYDNKVTCSTCHDPHMGTGNPSRLRKSYIDTVRDLIDIDPHYRQSLCFYCHKETEGYPLLTTDPVALCNRCHGTGDIIGDTHPLKPLSPEMTIPQDWPVNDDGSLTCLTCHRAGHKQDKPFYMFLRGGPYGVENDFCFLCHSREAFKNRDPHLDINQLQGCEFCHSVRPVPGKDNARTIRLRADANLLCLRCHEYSPHPAGADHNGIPSADIAEVIPDDYPLDGRGRITCATCHNPHIEGGGGKLRGVVTGIMICANCHRY